MPGTRRAAGPPAAEGPDRDFNYRDFNYSDCRGAPVETIRCHRCDEDAAKLDRPPFRNDLGQRIHETICKSCWADWLQHQTLLINHYGLDPRDAKAREFLYAQIEKVLLGEGEGEEIDTSRQGSVEW